MLGGDALCERPPPRQICEVEFAAAHFGIGTTARSSATASAPLRELRGPGDDDAVNRRTSARRVCVPRPPVAGDDRGPPRLRGDFVGGPSRTLEFLVF